MGWPEQNQATDARKGARMLTRKSKQCLPRLARRLGALWEGVPRSARQGKEGLLEERALERRRLEAERRLPSGCGMERTLPEQHTQVWEQVLPRVPSSHQG